MNTSSIRAVANDINEVCPLVLAPEIDSDAWNVVSGRPGREYFDRSPYATITAYQRGFVVHNRVTGGQHPVATWTQATDLRATLAQRYVAIQNARY